MYAFYVCADSITHLSDHEIYATPTNIAPKEKAFCCPIQYTFNVHL